MDRESSFLTRIMVCRLSSNFLARAATLMPLASGSRTCLLACLIQACRSTKGCESRFYYAHTLSGSFFQSKVEILISFFRSVAVMACDDEIIPLQARIESVAEGADIEEAYKTERHLLYVACTVPRDLLLITGVEPV